MASRPSWRKRRRSGPGPGDDPELWAIFEAGAGRTEPGLLDAAREIRTLAVAGRAPEAPASYRAHLRASLMEEAHLRSRLRPRQQRRFGLVFGAGLGIAGLAMVALVLVSVVGVPGSARSVTVRASVAGNPRVPVTQAIQLSFNQPMVESSVIKGLTIAPAVSYQAEWPDPSTLVIAPQHDLVPNVSYVVSIARKAARAQNGAMALSKVVIPFGTEPTSSTAQGYPPSLVAIDQLALANGAEGLTFAPTGALLLTASGSVAAFGSTAPVTSPTLGTAAGAASVYSLSDLQTPVATNAVNPVASPDGQQLAYWSLTGRGVATLMVSPLGGQGEAVALASTTASNPQAAWLNDSTLLYASAGQLLQINLDGQTSAVDAAVRLGPAGMFTVAPGAQALFARPASVPTVYDLGNGTSTAIPGLEGTPEWSPSGAQMAYVAASGSGQAIYLATTFGGLPRQLLVAPQGVSLADLAYSPDGAYLAYTASTPGIGSQIGAVDIATGTSSLLSTRVGMSNLTWSPFGSALAALQSVPTGGSEVIELQLSNPPQTATSGTQAATALAVASNLAQLQITNSPAAAATIQSLLAPGTTISKASLLPGAFDRFYAVSSTPLSAGSNTFQVEIELVQDATATQPAAFLEEQVLVDDSGTNPLISAITPGSLTALPTGPLVVSATAASIPGGGTTFTIQFNSDLDPVTVGPQSISLSDNGQPVTNLQITYQATTRQATIITGPLASGPLLLEVAAPLADVNHVQIAIPYQWTLPTAPPAVPPTATSS